MSGKKNASASSKKNPFSFLFQTKKGEFGYFQAEKKRRFLITALLFSVPLFIFFSAWIYHGTRLTIWTVLAVVGCLPACKSLVGLIMILMRKPISRQTYESIASHAGTLTMIYEVYMTFYDKSAVIDALAVCGNQVVGYSSDPSIDTAYMEQESQKIIRKNGYKVTVKILRDLRPYLERLDSMNAHRESIEEGIRFTPDERNPDLSRNDLIRQTILAICL